LAKLSLNICVGILLSASAAWKLARSRSCHVRKSAKEHGARERIGGHLCEGAEVLMVDDVATTGRSILKAVEGMKSDQRRFDVRRALVVVDREEAQRTIWPSIMFSSLRSSKEASFQPPHEC
jgi:orotate phosphoribosyltransferase